MPYPAKYKYTKEHEWLEINDTIGTIGITDYAQNSLGDIVFVDLPAHRPPRSRPAPPLAPSNPSKPSPTSSPPSPAPSPRSTKPSPPALNRSTPMPTTPGSSNLSSPDALESGSLLSASEAL